VHAQEGWPFGVLAYVAGASLGAVC
jgi:hypothetical protein